MHFPTIPSSIMVAFAASVLATPVELSQNQAITLTLQQKLELAGTAVDRLALITNDQDFVFDFNASTKGVTAGKGTRHIASLVFPQRRVSYPESNLKIIRRQDYQSGPRHISCPHWKSSLHDRRLHRALRFQHSSHPPSRCRA